MKKIAYVYLLRVQIISCALLIGFPLFALWNDTGRALFENLFNLDVFGTFLAAFAALIAAWSILLTSNVTLFNARDRFDVPPVLTSDSLKWWLPAAAGMLAVPALVCQFVLTRILNTTIPARL